MAMQFLGNSGYIGFRHPAKLLFLAIQIYSHCWFRHTIPYKSGSSYRGCATGLGLPPIEFALCSCPVVDLILPSIDYIEGRYVSVLWQGMLCSLYRDILYRVCRDVLARPAVPA